MKPITWRRPSGSVFRASQSKEAPPTPYEPVRIAAGPTFALPDLAGFRIVVLCNVASVSREDAGWLSRFVDAGGSLIVFLGDHSKANAYTTLESENVLPGQIGDPAESGPYRIGEWTKDHPILAPFADPLHGDLRTFRFRKIARISPVPEARVLATARGGLPILLERTKGRGTLSPLRGARRQRLGRLGDPSALRASRSPGRRLLDRPPSRNRSCPNCPSPDEARPRRRA